MTEYKTAWIKFTDRLFDPKSGFANDDNIYGYLLAVDIAVRDSINWESLQLELDRSGLRCKLLNEISAYFVSVNGRSSADDHGIEYYHRKAELLEKMQCVFYEKADFLERISR